MMYLLIVSLLIYAAYNNQTTYINYLLLLCLLLGIISILFTIITSFTIKLDLHIDKEICYKNQGKKITFTSSSFIHPTAVVKVSLYNKQLKRKQGSYYIDVKTDGATYYLPTEECGDYELTTKKYSIKGFFGLFRIKKKFYNHDNFRVYPKPSSFTKDDIKELILTGDGEPINKKGGDYQELYEIRPIQPGDNLRYVHPSLSAKFGEYMVKVGSETQRKLMLYEMKETKDFYESINDLRKISAMYEELCKDYNNYFCVKFKNNWYIILNNRALFGLFDLVYEEFEK